MILVENTVFGDFQIGAALVTSYFKKEADEDADVMPPYRFGSIMHMDKSAVGNRNAHIQFETYRDGDLFSVPCSSLHLYLASRGEVDTLFDVSDDLVDGIVEISKPVTAITKTFFRRGYHCLPAAGACLKVCGTRRCTLSLLALSFSLAVTRALTA